MGDTSKLPSLDDFADAEHCVLEETQVVGPRQSATGGSRQPRTIQYDLTISDALRGWSTRVTIYAEGIADIETSRRGSEPESARYDLRYLDPTPISVRRQASGLFRAAGLVAGLSGLATIAGILQWAPAFALWTGIGGLVVTALMMFTGVMRSHETISFRTLHGRAEVMCLRAGLGKIGQFQGLIPKLSDAIASAADSVHEQTAVYLRAEMREHYRLRGDGVLTDEECANSTGKILNAFKGPL